MSSSDILKRKKPRTRSVEITLDDEQLERRDELIAEISRIKRLESWADSGDMASPLPALQDELRELLEAIDESTVTFEFKASAATTGTLRSRSTQTQRRVHSSKSSSTSLSPTRPTVRTN